MSSATSRPTPAPRHRGRPRRRTWQPAPIPEHITLPRSTVFVAGVSALAITISGWTTLLFAR